MGALEDRPVTELSDYRERRALRLPPALGAPPPTGTVTFLLTDIEGSTRRWESDPAAMTAAIERHYEILDLAVLAHGGIRPVEQGEGDSMVASFARASDAVGAALDAQLALQVESWPQGADLRVRMALHTGEAQLREDIYYVGPSIIRTARLRALAHGGQVLVSNATAELLAAGLPADAALVPLGVHRLKDLQAPERVFQLTHPALRAQFPPLHSPEAHPHNLPAQLTSFVGRRAELAELAGLTVSHRLVTLLGPGGSGKTRLAVQAASAAVDGYPDGIWFVDLSAVADPDRVPEAAMAAIGLDGKGIDPLARLTGYLAERRVLLVVDNCEHVLDAAAALLGRVLLACPAVGALATSREPLGVGGERVVQVPPLGLAPGGEDVPLEEVLAAEAVRLFADRAADARAGFALDARTAPTVAAICARLDGIPLAIELAAARIRALSPERLLDSLADRFRVLTGGARTAPARHQTLAASVEWSHDLLTEGQQVLLRRLAAFAGDFDLAAAEAVCPGPVDGGAELAEGDVLTLLTDLVDRSLVVFDGDHYRMLQTIRDFAAARLAEAGEEDSLADAHLRHYARFAADGARELEASPRVPVLERLEAARRNILAAVDTALATGQHEAALELCGDMALFWQLHGHHSESLACVRRVLAATSEEVGPQRARALGAAGQLGFYAMDVNGGYGSVETARAVELARATGSDAVLGRSLGMQGFLTVFGAPAAAPGALAEAYAAAERAADPYGMRAATAYTAIGWVFGCDRPDEAEPYLARLAADADGSWWAVWHGIVRGWAAWRTGRLHDAVAAFTRADDLAWTLGDPVLESWAATWLAETYVCLGDADAAERAVARSAAWMDRSSFGRLEIVTSRRVAVQLLRGDVPAAKQALAAVERIARSMGFPCVTLEIAVLTARLALADGELEAARAGLAEATGIAEALGTPWYLASVAELAGLVARAAGEPGEAEDAHQRALELCVRHNFRGAAAGTLESLASLACAGESETEAARLLGAAEALRAATGQRRWGVDQPAYDRDAAALLAALGEPAYSDALAEGRDLYLPEAAAYAGRARGERKRPSRGWAALTPTELEVAALAVQGLTNAEIGQRLFITPGTAKVHLSHIYTKLGVANRTQLAVQAAARGIGST